jgi:citrate synthase
MNVFWRQKPLPAQQAKLLELVLDAHSKSAARGNISTVVICNAGVGSGNYMSAIAAGLCSVGAVHAPLAQAWQFLMQFNADDVGELARHIEMGGKIPGWGSDFFKEGPDPLWKGVADQITELAPKWSEKIGRVTDELHARGKMIYPNPACYTAVSAIILEIPPPLIGWLFIRGRLDTWSAAFYQALAAQNAPKQKEGVLV